MISFFGGPRGFQGERGEKGEQGSPINIIKRYFSSTPLTYETNIFDITLYKDSNGSNKVESSELLDLVIFTQDKNNNIIISPDTPWIAVVDLNNNKLYGYRPSEFEIEDNKKKIKTCEGINLASELSMYWKGSEQEPVVFSKILNDEQNGNEIVFNFQEKRLDLKDTNYQEVVDSLIIPQKGDNENNKGNGYYATPELVDSMIQQVSSSVSLDYGQYYITSDPNKAEGTNSNFIKCAGGSIKQSDPYYNNYQNLLLHENQWNFPKDIVSTKTQQSSSTNKGTPNMTNTKFLAKAISKRYVAILSCDSYATESYSLDLFIYDNNSNKLKKLIIEAKKLNSSSGSMISLKEVKASLRISEQSDKILIFLLGGNYYIYSEITDISNKADQAEIILYGRNKIRPVLMGENGEQIGTIELTLENKSDHRFLDTNTFIFSAYIPNLSDKPNTVEQHAKYLGILNNNDSIFCMPLPFKQISTNFSFCRFQHNSSAKEFYILNGSTYSLCTIATENDNIDNLNQLKYKITYTQNISPLDSSIKTFLDSNNNLNSMQYGTYKNSSNSGYDNYNLTMDKNSFYILHLLTYNSTEQKYIYKKEDFSSGKNKDYLRYSNFNYDFLTKQLIISGVVPSSSQSGTVIGYKLTSQGEKIDIKTYNYQISTKHSANNNIQNYTFQIITDFGLPLFQEMEISENDKEKYNFSIINSDSNTSTGTGRRTYRWGGARYYFVKEESLQIPDLCDPSKQLYYYLIKEKK